MRMRIQRIPGRLSMTLAASVTVCGCLFPSLAHSASAEPKAEARTAPYGSSGRGAQPAVKWIPFPDERLSVCGLPWFRQNAPDLCRFPRRTLDGLPKRVQSLARFPAGGRIRFTSNTSQLRIRMQATERASLRNMSPFGSRGLDVYVDGFYWSSVCVGGSRDQEAVFFHGAERRSKRITIYLPLFQQLRVLAIGVDEGAELKPPPSFSRKRPVVFYGSSIAQGACASRPGMTYQAILARRLNVDFVNLGFSGSGRGEPEVVRLIAQIDACCYVFDLGKSYRTQPEDVYAAMLAAIRASRPNVPLVCMTPIFSTREFFDAEYAELSRYTRKVMRNATVKRIQGGDDRVILVEGLDLLGRRDAHAFQEGVHPTDLGFARIADRLAPMLEGILPAEK